MPQDINDPATGSGEQSENAPSAHQDNAISALSNYRARQAASTPATQERGTGGAAGPNTGATPQPEREPYIPRERFDEVNTKLKSEVEALKQQMAQMAQYRPQSGPVAQPQHQPSVTGMIGAQQAPNLPNFQDPAVKKEWSERIYKDPVGGLTALVEALIEARGTPLLQQFQQQIAAQLTPIQQTFIQNQLAGYEQRASADPSFQAIRGTFTSLATEAVSRGIALTPQTLQAIEGIARAQAGLPFGAPAPTQAAPFSEQPGAAAGNARPATNLTSEQRQYAQLFGMNEADYAAWYERNGVTQ